MWLEWESAESIVKIGRFLKNQVKVILPKSKVKVKGQDSSNKDSKLPSTHKCPILMATTQFEVSFNYNNNSKTQIPVHPFILDMRSIYTLQAGPLTMRVVRFINDNSKMLRYFLIGKEHRGARIPCRLKDCNAKMELMIFWSNQSSKKYYSILNLVDAVLGCSNVFNQQYNGPVQEAAIRELHLPLWEQSYEATNLAHPISKVRCCKYPQTWLALNCFWLPNEPRL